MTYTAFGSVRGDCGHAHRSARSARRCAAKDERACAAVRGYSDRRAYPESSVLRNAVGDVYAVIA